MSIKNLNPHLAFDGTADKAIRLYEKALGAKAENIMRFGDAASMGHPAAPEHKDRVLHAVVRIGEGSIMVMDSPPGMPVPTQSNVQISLDFDDVADMAEKFDALAVGGQVTMALHDAFWGARFGMLTDAFAIRWMFNCALKKP